MIAGIGLEASVLSTDEVALCILSSLDCEDVECVLNGHIVVGPIFDDGVEGLLISKELLFGFAKSHGSVAVAEAAEAVLLASLEDIEGVACCIGFSKVITENISFVLGHSSYKAAAVFELTVCSVEADNESEGLELGAEVEVAGGIHEACNRTMVAVLRSNSIDDSGALANALGLCFGRKDVSSPSAIFVCEPAAAVLVIIMMYIFAVFKNIGHGKQTGAVLMEIPCVDCSTDRISSGSGAYPNINAVFIKNFPELFDVFGNGGPM